MYENQVIFKANFVNLQAKNGHLMADKQYQTEGNRLKVLLAERGRTVRWLADQLGKSEHTVSRWCLNKIQPSVPQLQEIARLFDVDIRELLTPTKKNV